MVEVYADALRKAAQELAEADAAAVELDRKRAKLRLTVAALKSMTGESAENEQTVTDAILTIVKGSSGSVTAIDVMDKLFMMGMQAQTASVATILSRLAKDGKVMKTRDGYRFSSIDLENPKTLRDAALLVIKSQPGTVPAKDVVDHLRSWWNGFPFKPQSVESFLANYASQKERLIDGRNTKPGGAGIVGYEWREPRTKAQMSNARKKVVDMNLKDLSL